jgi:hypothetical protein
MFSWLALPAGSIPLVFIVCLIAGAFAVFMFCLDRFDKLSVHADENDPWQFVVPRYLTPPDQYIIGFLVYCGSMLLIFAIASLLGPKRIFDIAAAMGGGDADKSASDFSTFPIVVAFFLVGLHPSLRLPPWADFEAMIRRFAYRLAYIPKNMDRIFNYMRFSDFDLGGAGLTEAWGAVDLDRPTLDAADVKALAPLLDRVVLLYVRAATLSGDLASDGAGAMAPSLSLEVFKQYRTEIGNVATNLQAMSARLAELAGQTPGDRRKSLLAVQHEVVRNLEFLYVIFACAIAGKSMDRMSERLRAIGFTSPLPPSDGIPWDPVLKTLGAAAVVLLGALVVAAKLFEDNPVSTYIPTDMPKIIQLLVTILFVHVIAVSLALSQRASMIGHDKYFSETGQVQALALIAIFFKCGFACFIAYLLLFFDNLLTALGIVSPQGLSAGALVGSYLYNCFVWTFVAAFCGATTAYVIDSPSDRYVDRATSGALLGVIMALAAVAATEFTVPGAPWLFEAFNVLIYGGLGFVIGFQLPAAVRRQWAAIENRLPDKIVVLRTSVRDYFRDIQQFTEWLNTYNDRLGGKRPLDMLAQDTGVQQLVTFVGTTRPKLT